MSVRETVKWYPCLPAMFNLLLLSCQSDRPQVSLQFYCYPLVICPYGKPSSLQEFILGSQEAYLALVACKFLISMYLNYLYLIYFSTLIFIITTSACDAGSSLSFVLDFGRRWIVLHCAIHVLKKCPCGGICIWCVSQVEKYPFITWCCGPGQTPAHSFTARWYPRKPGLYSPYIVESSFHRIFFVKHF